MNLKKGGGNLVAMYRKKRFPLLSEKGVAVNKKRKDQYRKNGRGQNIEILPAMQ